MNDLIHKIHLCKLKLTVLRILSYTDRDFYSKSARKRLKVMQQKARETLREIEREERDG